MSGVNKLMFQVGIEEVERKLSSVRAEYDSFAEKYKDGITIKLKLDEAESLASSLSKIGDPKAPMPYLDEIERLKKLLGDAKNAIDFLLSLFYIKPQPMICISFCFSRLQQTKCIRSGDDLLLLFQNNLAKNIDIKILSFHQSFELGVQERNGGTVVFTHFEYTVLCL